jgi:hypothetical protein
VRLEGEAAAPFAPLEVVKAMALKRLQEEKEAKDAKAGREATADAAGEYTARWRMRAVI